MSASDSRTFRLVHDIARNGAVAAIRAAPQGYVVTVRPATRSGEQNAALHAALTDIAEQIPWRGQMLTVDVWKRLTMAAWLREEGQSPEMVPALDGQGFDVIFERSSHLTVRQMSSLLEWVKAFAAQNGVVFKNEAGR